MTDAVESQLRAFSEIATSLKLMGECNTTIQELIKQRAPYLMAVQTATPEQKMLMLLSLTDFDRQSEPVVNDYKRKMREAIQRFMDHGPELLKFFE